MANNVGYSPVRQPIGATPPVDIPSSYNMSGFNANINSSARIASGLNSLAPALMQLGVGIKLNRENRLGYTKELQARSTADHSAFEATVAQETAKLTTDISKLNDKNLMNETLDLRLESLRSRITGADGQTPLIRNKKEQQQYLQFLDRTVRKHWETSIYTRSASLDAQNTKAKADMVIEQGVDIYDKDRINQGVQIKLDAGQLTPEQAKLEIYNKTLEAQTKDLNRVVELTNSGDRFVYLQGLEMSEEEAERNGYSTSELAKMFMDKMKKDRIEKGMYDLVSTDDIGVAVSNMETGIASIETRQETVSISTRNRMEKQQKETTYNYIDELITNPVGFYNLSVDQKVGYTKMIVPSISHADAENLVNHHEKIAHKPLTQTGYRRYNKLIYESSTYNPSNDPDGSKAASIYMDAMNLPDDEMYSVIRHLNSSALNIPIGKVNADGKRILINQIHEYFLGVKHTKWMGDTSTKIKYHGKDKSVKQAEAEFISQFETMVYERNMTLEEAREFLDNSPIIKNLDNYTSLETYENNLNRMSDPFSRKGPTKLPY